MNRLKKKEQEFNISLGKRLFLLRKGRNWSQEYLGSLMGLKYQQIAKYESGENRMPPQRIDMCADIFGVPITFFYGRDETHSEALDKNVLIVASEIVDLPDDIQKGIYYLSKEINKICKKKTDENKEQAA